MIIDSMGTQGERTYWSNKMAGHCNNLMAHWLSCLRVDSGCQLTVYLVSSTATWASSQHGGQILSMSILKNTKKNL